MMLADSNLIIYAASGKYPRIREWFSNNALAISAVTLVEVLGYHKLTSDEKSVLQALFGELTILYPAPDDFQSAISLRQQRSISVADVMIAAAALRHDLPLATHNTEDFAWVSGLQLVDPLEDPTAR